jgi:DNA-binding NarL/FixJ family response regulator
MNNPISIALIDDDEEWRGQCAELLALSDEFLVVGNYQSIDQAKINLRPNLATIILLGLNSVQDLQAIVALKKLDASTSIIAVSQNVAPSIMFEAFGLGVAGFLSKESSIQRLSQALTDVYEGGGAMSPNETKTVINFFQKNPNSPLTRRETDVMFRLAQGQTKTQIAAALFINQNTVRSHVKSIYIKLNVNSKSDAIASAKQLKLI